MTWEKVKLADLAAIWSWSADLIFGWILFVAGVLSVLLHKMTTTGRVIFTFLCDKISEAVTRLDFFV